MDGAVSPFYKPQQLPQILFSLADQFPLSYVVEWLILHGVISHCPLHHSDFSLSKACAFWCSVRLASRMSCIAHCAALRFLSAARMSRLLKLTLVGERTVSQSVGVVSFKISSKVSIRRMRKIVSRARWRKNSGEAMHLDGRLGRPFRTGYVSSDFQVFGEQSH